MGKKKKVDIKGAPLQSVTIGQIKKSKFGWIRTILLFGIFGSVIYFLPYLTKVYQETGGLPGMNIQSPGDGNNTVVLPEDGEGEDEDLEVESNVYTFGTDLTVSKADLTFSNIRYVNNILTFTLTNNSENSYKLEELNLYFETYDANTEEKNTINVIAIHGDLSAGNALEFSYEIKPGALYFDIKEIKEEDYTYVDFTPNESGNIVLTCKKGNETLIYTFVNDKLQLVESSIEVLRTDANYNTEYSKYNSLVVKYSNMTGADAKLSTYSTHLLFNLKLNYDFFGGNIENDYYFTKGISPRVVNFKMESVLFECS